MISSTISWGNSVAMGQRGIDVEREGGMIQPRCEVNPSPFVV